MITNNKYGIQYWGSQTIALRPKGNYEDNTNINLYDSLFYVVDQADDIEAGVDTELKTYIQNAEGLRIGRQANVKGHVKFNAKSLPVEFLASIIGDRTATKVTTTTNVTNPETLTITKELGSGYYKATLAHSNIIDGSLTVFEDGVPLNIGSDYWVNTETGEITFVKAYNSSSTYTATYTYGSTDYAYLTNIIKDMGSDFYYQPVVVRRYFAPRHKIVDYVSGIPRLKNSISNIPFDEFVFGYLKPTEILGMTGRDDDEPAGIDIEIECHPNRRPYCNVASEDYFLIQYRPNNKYQR